MKFALMLVCLLLVASLAENLSQWWQIETLRSRRPAGVIGRLRHDLPIYLLGTTDSPLILPKGMLLQESTPNGAATLGKQYGHEFFLGVHTDNNTFEELLEVDHTSDGEHIEIPYSFDQNDKTWWLARPNKALQPTAFGGG